MRAVIPSSRTSKILISHHREISKLRNWIERRVNKLKHFRRFSTRFDRRDVRILAFTQLAADLDSHDVDSA